MSLTELAEASGQAPATVYRVLSTFEAHGVVEVQPATQLWFVGQEAFRIGSAFLGRTSLVEQARGVMHGLMAETGETANLAIADGGQVVFISQVETHEPIRAFFRPGTRGPIHASGIGKALLAYHSPEAVERIVREQGLAAFTERTITEPARLVGRAGGDPGAGLGGRRRGADRGDALHRGADLQRVPRGDGGGFDLGADGADGALGGAAPTRSRGNQQRRSSDGNGTAKFIRRSWRRNPCWRPAECLPNRSSSSSLVTLASIATMRGRRRWVPISEGAASLPEAGGARGTRGRPVRHS